MGAAHQKDEDRSCSLKYSALPYFLGRGRELEIIGAYLSTFGLLTSWKSKRSQCIQKEGNSRLNALPREPLSSGCYQCFGQYPVQQGNKYTSLDSKDSLPNS